MADKGADASPKLPVGASGKDGKEICRAFRNTGNCRFANECKYEHSQGAQIEAPPRDYTPKGDCNNWSKDKTCRFGDRCRFVHGPEDKRTTYRPPRTESSTTPSGEQEVCRNFQKRGKCRFGENCRHKHVEGDRSENKGERKEQPKRPKRESAKSGGAGPGAGGATADGARRRRTRRRGPREDGAGAGAGEQKVLREEDKYDKDGIELCRNFRNKGECRFGDECTYSHAPGGPIGQPAGSGGAGGGGRRRPAGGAGGAPREVGQCNLFTQNGECKFGEDCRFKHGENDKRDFAEARRRRRTAGGDA